MHIIELLTPTYDAAWLPWAVQYFFLIGVAATAAIIVAVCTFARPGSQRARLLPSGAIVLAVSTITSPVSLLADLHQPARFWHFYTQLTPWSWMWLGAYLLPVFVMLALGWCVAWWAERRRGLLALSIPLAVSALSILIYTGAELMVVRARPLWSTPLLPINLALTGALAALGAMMLIARWLPGGLPAFPLGLLRRLTLTVAASLAAAGLIWAVTGWMTRAPSFMAASQLATAFPAWRVSLIGSAAVGLATLMALARPVEGFVWRRGAIALSLTLLTAAWMFRWTLFMSVQGVPKYGAGLYVYRMPLGGDGLLGMLGMFGLCAALLAGILALANVSHARGTGPRGATSHRHTIV
jgi:tetrathionate reductase subunit C